MFEAVESNIIRSSPIHSTEKQFAGKMLFKSTFEYSHIAVDGIDHNVVAELCSSKFLNNPFAKSKYQNIKNDPSGKAILTKRIANIIRRSKYSVNVAISALILVERFHEAIIAKKIPFSQEVEDAGHLFFIAYMVAAKVVCDNYPFICFWRQVSNYEYSGDDITRMEFQFYDVVGWKVQIDAKAFNRGLIGMKESYSNQIGYKLPSAPAPVYRRLQKNQTARTITKIGREEYIPNPILEEENNEVLLVQASPVTKYRGEDDPFEHQVEFFHIVLQATQFP
ncbi:hypothetical protein JR316_0004588 [Psilocybe cubensis]|uniref:Uncharacterized protein n=2 Tax=Psilocybe cubensis TaxID=181762 RepID=A0ACB8H3W9_PSICU|nr:hypothetical protein JR316_0004588 [Psilocybe cubensis]KAH9482488.1 hypothetical protein JR316_0004588 [Psilocybe cubensis]